MTPTLMALPAVDGLDELLTLERDVHHEDRAHIDQGVIRIATRTTLLAVVRAGRRERGAR